jgi:hypothetical protein
MFSMVSDLFLTSLSTNVSLTTSSRHVTRAIPRTLSAFSPSFNDREPTRRLSRRASQSIPERSPRLCPSARPSPVHRAGTGSRAEALSPHRPRPSMIHTIHGRKHSTLCIQQHISGSGAFSFLLFVIWGNELCIWGDFLLSVYGVEWTTARVDETLWSNTRKGAEFSTGD